MKIINVHQAKTHLSKLLDRVVHGEEIILGKTGKPVAKITAFDLDAQPRKPGLWKGKVRMARDFDKMPVSFMKFFTGDA